MDHKKRFGRFTSSNIYKLFGSPKVRKTYIEEAVTEIKLGKSLSMEFWSAQTSWGKLMEILAFNDLSQSWEIVSNTTLEHPKYGKYWSGTPDFNKYKKLDLDLVGEMKGYYYKNFVNLTDAILEKDFVKFKTNFKKEYWQIVSNSTISGVKRGAIISYMPYESQYETIQDLIRGFSIHDNEGNLIQWRLELYESIKWIMYKSKKELHLLPDNGYYKNLNVFEFDIPEEDIKALTDQVKEDSKALEETHKLIKAA